jgi:hypothetical protein
MSRGSWPPSARKLLSPAAKPKEQQLIPTMAFRTAVSNIAKKTTLAAAPKVCMNRNLPGRESGMMKMEKTVKCTNFPFSSDFS